MKNILLSIGFIALAHLPIFACSWSGSGISFTSAVKNDDSMIARGRILEKFDSYLLVELYDVYRGDETRCKIKIFNQKDWSCTGTPVDYELAYFGEVGQTLLFHADKISAVQNAWEELGEYRNEYYRFGNMDLVLEPVIQDGKKLKGLFAEGINSVKVDQVAEKLVEYGVSDLLPFSRPLCGLHSLKIYPNPAIDFFFVNDEIGDEAELLIYNMSGQLVLSKNQVYKGKKNLLSNLAAGLYIVVVKSSTATFQQKLLIR